LKFLYAINSLHTIGNMAVAHRRVTFGILETT
jgi:hypothetical protein